MKNVLFIIGLLCLQPLYSTPDNSFLIDTSIAYGPAYGTRSDPSIAHDGTNFLAVWADNRKGYDMYGTRLKSDGTVLDPTGIRLAQTKAYQYHNPGIAFNGSQYVIVYRDRILDSLAQSSVFAVRVTTDGTVLDTAGIALSSRVNCGYPSIVFGDSLFFVIWYDNDNNIYGTRLSTSGIPLDPDGIAISKTGTSFNHASAGFDGTSFWAAWNTPSGVRAARISLAGELLDTTAIPVSQKNSSRDWLKPSIASGDNQNLIVWTDAGNNRKIRYVFGARVSPEGIVLDTAGISIASIDGYDSYPSAFCTGEKYYVVWGDNAINYGVRGAFLLSDGSVQDTFSITASGGGTPVTVSDSTFSYTLWREGDEFTHDAGIYGSRVSHNGTLLDAQPRLLSTALRAQSNPSVCSNGTEFLLVWQELCTGTGHDIYGIRIDSTGIRLQPRPFLIFSDSGDQRNHSSACGTSTYFASWNNGRKHIGVSGAIVSQSGSTADTILHISDYGHAPSVTFNGSHFMVFWVNNYDFLYGALVAESGAIKDPGIFILNTDDIQSKPYDPPAAAVVDSTTMVIWSPFSEPG